MIYQAGAKDVKTVAEMALILWQNHTLEELSSEFETILSGNQAVIFIATEHEQPIGFAQCSLRHDYVEGTNSSPVGYLEGIFVKDDYRKQGYAAQLLSACEKWASKSGCIEFASDCESDNESSRSFHYKLGFQEANRIICFTKKLNKA